uniref:uncharacterized protein LOC120337532 n=1 Tax=Styela clava TaxID=7725 RepID=UPI00193AD368|nr:uncharacterized protein LOC120337532 [Styela clava]
MASFSNMTERSDNFGIRTQAEQDVLKLREELFIIRQERDTYRKECMKLRQLLTIKNEAERERNEALQRMLNAQVLESRLSRLIYSGAELSDSDEELNYGILRHVQPQRDRDEDVDTLYSNITTTSAQEATDDIKSLEPTQVKVHIDHNEEIATGSDYLAPDLPPRPSSFSTAAAPRRPQISSVGNMARLSRSEAALSNNRPKKTKFVKKWFRKSKQAKNENREYIHKF